MAQATSRSDSTAPSFPLYSVSITSSVEIDFPRRRITFRHRDGLPIKLSPNSIATIRTSCEHLIEHAIDLHVKPRIEWRIEERPKKAGAFKKGHDNAEYLSRDFGECVIYHPPPDMPDRHEVSVVIVIKYDGQAQEETYRMTITMERIKGIGKGISSVATVGIKEIIGSAKKPFCSTHEKCKSCNLVLEAEESPPFISAGGYLTTSEYVKMNAEKVSTKIWLASNARRQTISDITPYHELTWHCSSGRFLGSEKGSEVIYLTPTESELSKSPVTLSLYQKGILKDKKSFWLLRRQSCMHC